jgi:hypothetical protein
VTVILLLPVAVPATDEFCPLLAIIPEAEGDVKRIVPPTLIILFASVNALLASNSTAAACLAVVIVVNATVDVA